MNTKYKVNRFVKRVSSKSLIVISLSVKEILSDSKVITEKELEELFIYGSYKQVVEERINKKENILLKIMKRILHSYSSDIRSLRRQEALLELLRILSLNIGKLISYKALAKELLIDKETVERYVDLLENASIIFKLEPFPLKTNNPLKTNKVISKLRKIYFYDLGIRNLLINNFQHLFLRNDVDLLWENFVIVERLKYCQKNNIRASMSFLRTYDNGEVNLIEQIDDYVLGYKIKFNGKNLRNSSPKAFTQIPNSQFQIITLENFLELIGFRSKYSEI